MDVFWNLLPIFVMCGISLTAFWKIFVKAGEPGWKVLIPIYSTYKLTEIATGSGGAFIAAMVTTFVLGIQSAVGLSFMSIISSLVMVIFSIYVMVQLGKSFGKGRGFNVGLALLGLYFTVQLAFSPVQYGRSYSVPAMKRRNTWIAALVLMLVSMVARVVYICSTYYSYWSISTVANIGIYSMMALPFLLLVFMAERRDSMQEAMRYALCFVAMWAAAWLANYVPSLGYMRFTDKTVIGLVISLLGYPAAIILYLLARRDSNRTLLYAAWASAGIVAAWWLFDMIEWAMSSYAYNPNTIWSFISWLAQAAFVLSGMAIHPDALSAEPVEQEKAI